MPLICDTDAERMLKELHDTTADSTLRMCLAIALAWKSSLDSSRALLADLNNQNNKLIQLVDNHLKDMGR